MTFNNSRENKLKRKLSQSSTSSSLSQSSASNNNSELLGNTNDAASASSSGRNKEDTELFNAITVQLGGKWKEICSQSPLLQARGSGMISQRWKTKIRYFVG
ncbi:2609_t:CDS:2 [Entrophospora sp. SA101]|nr:2609_t:CDS:2 [Entrophospora sp. SA101]CAJ0846203.1 9393_t:CDS:2 [Entrophospora sp. SA101]